MVGSIATSLRAQRRLSDATNELYRSFQRLSSGSRINRASDDAAGLSIADSLRTKSRLYSTAVRNASDGVSMLNIIDSTIEQQISIVGRLQELATQSANGSLSSSQRRTLNAEYRALLDESGRLAETAMFNGRSLLSGSAYLEQLYLQVGIDGSRGSRIQVDLTSTNRLSGSLSLEKLMIGVDGYHDFALDDGDRTIQFAEGTAGLDGAQYGAIMTNENGDEFAIVLVDAVDDGTNVDVVFQVAVKRKGATGFSIDTVNGDNGIFLRFNKSSGEMVNAAGEFSALGGTIAQSNGTFSTDLYGSIQLDFRGLTIGNESAGSAIGFTQIDTVRNARTAIDTLSQRMSQLSALRGKFGATGSRLDFSINLLRASKEVTDAAEGRIRDVDVAAEAALMIVAQLKQRAAASVLALISDSYRIDLDLLRG